MPQWDEGVSGQSAFTGISFCEINNDRDNQQDAIFVGKIKNKKAVENPELFYASTIDAIVSDHENHENGTTLCSVIVQPNGRNPTIITANIGDSRAALVIKYKDKVVAGVQKFAYKSVALTEDHNLDRVRCVKEIEEKGGIVVSTIYDDGVEIKRVNNDLKLAAAVGDVEYPLKRKPDIWKYNLIRLYDDLQINARSVVSTDLIVACDGVWDVFDNAGEYTSVDGTDQKKIYRQHDNVTDSLAILKQEFDETDVEKSFSQFVTNRSANGKIKYPTNKGTVVEEDNADNISVIHIPLIVNGTIMINEPTMATVCDGHGGVALKDEDITLSVTASPKIQDGALVSASVAAKLYVAAEVAVETAMNLVTTGNPPDYFSKFVELNQRIWSSAETSVDKTGLEKSLTQLQGWEVDNDLSNSIVNAQATSLSATLYQPKLIAASSYWSDQNKDKRSKSDLERGNKFKTVAGLYKDQAEVEDTMLEIIIAAADKSGVSLEEALVIIQNAQKAGGVGNKKDNTKQFSHADKKFSKAFQDQCQKCGILTGRDDAANPYVGMRTTYIPESVMQKFEDYVGNGSTTGNSVLFAGTMKKVTAKQGLMEEVTKMRQGKRGMEK